MYVELVYAEITSVLGSGVRRILAYGYENYMDN